MMVSVALRSFHLSPFYAFLKIADLELDEPRYDRDRSASPRPMKRDDSYRGGRDRSASPNGRMNSRSVNVSRRQY